MNRFSKLAAAFAVLPIVAFASPAFADSPGQLVSGSNFYVVKNATQNGSYGSSANITACGDVLEYSIDLHNGAYGGLTNINVKATLSGSGSTATATPAESAAQGASGSVTTTGLGSGQSLAYQAGSTTLFNGSGSVIKTLPDTITTSGVNVGDLNGSTVEFVNFKAKVSCPTPTPVVSFACTELDVTQIDRTHYDFTAHASVQNAAVKSYGFTAKNSNGSTVDTNTVSTNALSAVYHFNQSNAGTYTVTAAVNTDHGSASSDNCVKQITVASVPTTPTTPTTPAPQVEGVTTLPNTGAGDVLGIFGATSAFGAAAHFVNSRRSRR